jgi:hypothetical protein
MWPGYGPNNEPYATLWSPLERMEYRARLEIGLMPTVEVWEDVSRAGGCDRTDGQGNRIYTKVRVVQVLYFLPVHWPRRGYGRNSCPHRCRYAVANTGRHFGWAPAFSHLTAKRGHSTRSTVLL